MRKRTGLLGVLSVGLTLSGFVGLVLAATLLEKKVDPSAAHFPQNKQNESPMAVNPVDAGNAISGANDEINEPDCTPATGGSSSCPFVLGVDTTGVYVTHDGGSNWSQTILDWCPNDDPTDPNCLLISDGDPVVAFGPKPDGSGGFTYASGARAYFASLAGRPAAGPDSELIAVSQSDDDGVTWSDPIVATTKDNPVEFNDKLAIWADQNPDSPHFGNVYVSWTLFTGTFPNPSIVREGPVFLPEPIVVASSTDGGQTWSKPRKLTPSHNNGFVGGRQGSIVRSAPNGDVYVFWSGAEQMRSAVEGARSTDGGVNFGRPFVVGFRSPNRSPLPGAGFRDNSFPMADIDASGNIHVVWTKYNRTTNHGIVEVATSTDSAATWSVKTAANIAGRSPFYPAVAAHGTNVFIGFNAIDDKPLGTAPGAGVVHYDAYYVLSTDGGANFSSAVKISAVSSDPDASSTNGLTAQFLGDYNGAAAGPDGAFWFSWTDTRNAATCAAVDVFRAGGSKPNIYDSCPAAFGNSDIFVAKITP